MTTLLVASTGGHLAQLFELASRIRDLGEDWLWVTFDSEQDVPCSGPRGRSLFSYRGTRRDGRRAGVAYARRLLRAETVRAREHGLGHRIVVPSPTRRSVESRRTTSRAQRAWGSSSLTGRTLQSIPGVCLYRQYPHVAYGRWHYGGSVFDGFRAVAVGARPVTRVVVTVGMERSFRRLIERVAHILPPDVEVLWQTGPTSIEGLGIDARPFVAASSLDQAMRAADVVVAHAGCGSALAALRAGRYPVLVPRDPHHGEVVDVHQIEIARWLGQQDSAPARTPDDLTFADLEAAARAVVRRPIRRSSFCARWHELP